MNSFQKNETCEKFEELLIKQSLDDLTQEEDQALIAHLHNCKMCQRYETAFSKLKNELHTPVNIKPDSSIKEYLFNRFDIKSKKDSPFLFNLWTKMRDVLEYRVPVYQGLVAGAIGFLIFMLSNFMTMTQNKSDLTPYQSNESINIYSDSMMVINKILILEQQKVGRSALEDSLLTRFIVDSL